MFLSVSEIIVRQLENAIFLKGKKSFEINQILMCPHKKG